MATVASAIARILDARNAIRSKLTSLGVANSNDDIGTLATKIESIVNRGAVNAEVKEGETYNIPAGYHNGSGVVAGVAGGGNYSLQEKSVTPVKAQQNVTADDGYYGLSAVTVAAIPANYYDVSSVTAEAGDVLANKIIVDKNGVSTAGTMTNNGDVSAAFDALTQSGVTIPSGYTSGGTVTLTSDLLEALEAI